MVIAVNEIDMMYINYALNNNGKIVDRETANAVNESIDRFCAMMDHTIELLDKDPEVRFIRDSIL